MTATNIIMLVLLAWILIACAGVFVSLWNLAKEETNK